MGKGKNKYTAEQFIKAIPGTGGIISAIARKVDCEWNTAKAYIDKYPTIKQAYDNECQTILDMAETGLYKAIREGKDWAIKYILSTKGKSRGSYRRDIIGDTRFNSKRAGEDLDFTNEILAKKPKCIDCGKTMIWYNYPREGSLAGEWEKEQRKCER